MVYAARQLPLGTQNLKIQASEVTPAIAVRGVAHDQTGLYGSVLQMNLTLIGIIMVFNLISLIVALSFFIIPLEKLAARLKSNVKVDLHDVSTLKIGRRYVVGASLTLLTSIICISLMMLNIDQAIHASVRAVAESNLGVGE